MVFFVGVFCFLDFCESNGLVVFEVFVYVDYVMVVFIEVFFELFVFEWEGIDERFVEVVGG